MLTNDAMMVSARYSEREAPDGGGDTSIVSGSRAGELGVVDKCCRNGPRPWILSEVARQERPRFSFDYSRCVSSRKVLNRSSISSFVTR